MNGAYWGLYTNSEDVGNPLPRIITIPLPSYFVQPAQRDERDRFQPDLPGHGFVALLQYYEP